MSNDVDILVVKLYPRFSYTYPTEYTYVCTECQKRWFRSKNAVSHLMEEHPGRIIRFELEEKSE